MQHHTPRTLSPAESPCARCGAVLRLDSRAFVAPVEHPRDGLICPGCDEAEMACAVDAMPVAVAAFCRAFDDTVTGPLVA